MRIPHWIAEAGLAICLAVFVLAPGPLSLVGAVGFFVLALGSPRAALAMVPLSLPVYLLPRSLGGLDISPPELALLATTAATVLRAALARLSGSQSLLRIRPTAFDAPLALLLAAALVSLLVTQYLRLSLRDLRTLILEPVVFYYLAVWLTASPAHARRLVGALVLGAVGASVVAIGQYGLDVGTTQAEGVRRVSALYQSPNHLALLLGRAIPFALAALLLLAGPARLLGGAATLVMGVALLATFSVGGWIGTAAGAAVVLFGFSRRLLVWSVLGSLVAAALATPLLGVERVVSHLDPASGSTTYIRLELWRASLAMLRDHPLLGIGLDNFLYLYRQEYLLPGAVAEPNLSHPHNLVLNFWLSMGLPALAAAGWLLWRFTQACRSLLRATRSSSVSAPGSIATADAGKQVWARALVLGAAGSMTDFVVHGLVDNSYFLVDMAFVFWLTLALVEQVRVLQSWDSAR